ncbi:putative hydrolase C777.06c isoform X6 [Magnolia sinica]|uniref:putative hydrolase C777.06c isoform X6 n=1 Tax=Magnolia sinica TaxID=86752 RepID=UPI00265916DB|nr:putative hydrolase C777.06c isoform X6 [Magnolia sinica]
MLLLFVLLAVSDANLLSATLQLHSLDVGFLPSNGFFKHDFRPTSPMGILTHKYPRRGLKSYFWAQELVKVCPKANEPGNKNRRLNTSILIHYHNSLGRSNILVDAGKFFYHSALRWFPMFGIRTIDAVIITHSHADAIGGLDDLRDWTNNVQSHIPIYVAKRDFEVMKKTHYYLVDTGVIIPGAAVSKLQFNIIKEEPFIVHNLEITPLPVWHGKGYRSLGFRFGNVCYISDASEIPEETYALLKDCEILILDALRPDRSSSTHFGLPRALEEVRKIKPRRALFTGMMHLMDHDKVNEDLAKLMETEGLDVQLSYDGLRIPFGSMRSF